MRAYAPPAMVVKLTSISILQLAGLSTPSTTIYKPPHPAPLFTVTASLHFSGGTYIYHGGGERRRAWRRRRAGCGAGAAARGDAAVAVRVRGVPRGVASGSRHGRQQARLPGVPQPPSALPPRPRRLLPREEGPRRRRRHDAGVPGAALPPLPLRHHRQPGPLPARARPHLADVRLGDPELRPSHHLRHGRRDRGRDGPARPLGWEGQGRRHGALRRRRVGRHALQGSRRLRPRGCRRHHGDGAARGERGGRRQELGGGVRVPDRALPVVVGMAGAAEAGAAALSGAPLCHLRHLLLRRPPVPRYRRLRRARRRRLARPLPLRALHHPLRGVRRVGRGVRGADMVRRPRRPGVRGGVPARADARRRRHGVHRARRAVLRRRNHRRGANHRRAVPGAVGQEPGEGVCCRCRRRRRHCRPPAGCFCEFLRRQAGVFFLPEAAAPAAGAGLGECLI